MGCSVEIVDHSTDPYSETPNHHHRYISLSFIPLPLLYSSSSLSLSLSTMASTTGSAHPLFSIAATSALLIFLYTPRPLLHFLLSPALIASLLCLAALLLLSSTHQQTPISPTQKPPEPRINFLEFSGPLEVIYEEYEGEEEDDSRDSDHSDALIERMRSTGMCYTDSSNSDSDDDDYLPENMCYRWEEEADGMIEIELEDENLIEIDISGGRRSPAGMPDGV